MHEESTLHRDGLASPAAATERGSRNRTGPPLFSYDSDRLVLADPHSSVGVQHLSKHNHPIYSIKVETEQKISFLRITSIWVVQRRMIDEDPGSVLVGFIRGHMFEENSQKNDISNTITKTKLGPQWPPSLSYED